MVNKSKKNI